MEGPLTAQALRNRFRRSGEAGPPRTLLDVFRTSVDAHGAAPAIDDGAVVLTYSELAAHVVTRAAELHAEGVRPGDRVGIRIASGTAELYVAILAILAAGAAYVPGGRGRPGRAGPAGLHRGRRGASCSGTRPRWTTPPRPHRRRTCRGRPPPPTTPGSSSPPARPGTPKGVAVHAPLGGRVRRRRVPAVPAGRRRWARVTGCWRAVGRLRRLVRGDVAGLGARRVPGAGAAVAGAQRDGPRAVAGRPADHAWSPPCRRSPASGRRRRSPRCGC